MLVLPRISQYSFKPSFPRFPVVVFILPAWSDSRNRCFTNGFEGLNCHDDDYDALRVYSAIMGKGGSSRLFQEIREKRGLVYGIGAGSEFFSDTGTFQVIAGTGKNEIKELLPVLCEELINSPKNLKEQEIEKSKAQLKTSTLMSIESFYKLFYALKVFQVMFDKFGNKPVLLQKRSIVDYTI